MSLRALLLLAVVGQLATAWLIWPDLPDQIPNHFDAAGCPDGWSERDVVEWTVIPVLMALAGLLAGFGLPALAARLARANSQWLNVPDRERFRELPEDARVRAMASADSWLLTIGVELQLLTGFLVYGTFQIATKRWECLSPVGLYGLLALLLATAIALAVASSRAVKREIAAG